MVASLVLTCGVVAGVLAALNIIRRFDLGWPSSHPWSTTASIIVPVMLVFLAFTFVSGGRRKRILAGIALALALGGTVCGVLALVA
jgi:hypothetical protein